MTKQGDMPPGWLLTDQVNTVHVRFSGNPRDNSLQPRDLTAVISLAALFILLKCLRFALWDVSKTQSNWLDLVLWWISPLFCCRLILYTNFNVATRSLIMTLYWQAGSGWDCKSYPAGGGCNEPATIWTLLEPSHWASLTRVFEWWSQECW